MNIGFYIENTNSHPENMEIYKTLNNLLKDNKVKDASLFFNNLDYVPVATNFGIFDGSEIWSFTGTLVCTSLNNLDKAMRATNKFKTVYLYDRTQKDNLFALLSTADLIKVVTTTEQDYNEYYRLTGVKPSLLEKLEDIVEIWSF